MTAVEIACRVCSAQPYEMCVRRDAYGKSYTAQVTHAERIEDAAAIGSRPEDPALVDATIAAVVNDLF